MSARLLLTELKRRLRERPIRAVAEPCELDFALIERIYGIAPPTRRAADGAQPR